MKLLVTSDWHLDASTAGIARFADVAASIDWTVEQAIANKVDLYLFLGDLCDPDANRTPACVSKAIRTAHALQRAGIESRWLVGNHDVIEDGSGTCTLEPLGAAGLPLRNKPSSEVIGGVMFVWLPFTPRTGTYDPEAFVRSIPSAPSFKHYVVAGHLNVPGVIPGSETHDMPRGRDVWFPVDAVRAHLKGALMMNGHYHGVDTDSLVVIPGSLERLTFNEERHVPSCLLVEIKGSKTTVVTALKNPLARALETIGPDDVAWMQDRVRWDMDATTIARLQPPANVEQAKLDSIIETLRDKCAALEVLPAPRAAQVVVENEAPTARKGVSTRSIVEELINAPMGADRDKVRCIVEEIMNEAGL